MVVSVVWLWLIVILLIPAIVVIMMMVPVTLDLLLLVVGILSRVCGLSAAIVLAAGSVYCCVATRVLTQEQGLPALRDGRS